MQRLTQWDQTIAKLYQILTHQATTEVLLQNQIPSIPSIKCHQYSCSRNLEGHLEYMVKLRSN